jgi:hypothetical protein
MDVAVWSYRYRRTRSDGALRQRPVEQVRRKPRSGYRPLHFLLVGSDGDVLSFSRERKWDAILRPAARRDCSTR